jgi:hypothetical protein
MAYSNYTQNFDVLSISSYNSGSEDPTTPDGCSDFYLEDFLNLNREAVADTDTITTDATTCPCSGPCFNPNDPLRYFMELGEITPEEYEKWKLVREEPAQHQHQNPSSESTKHKRKTPDFGPGYNSDSDPDSDDSNSDDNTNRPTTVFGTGYSLHQVGVHKTATPVDPWNPHPDPTSSNDGRYTKTANDTDFLRTRLTRAVQYDHSATGPGNKHNLQLGDSLELKLAWERFASPQPPPSHRFRTLQDFWQANALKTYEALQDLREDHAKVRSHDNHDNHDNHNNKREGCLPKDTPDTPPSPPQYHTTPIETLENTFETIGRMSRCIAEDFNTPTVVNYVQEYIIALYREIEFNALVEAYEESISIRDA